jgi:hypothetical protein
MDIAKLMLTLALDPTPFDKALRQGVREAEQLAADAARDAGQVRAALKSIGPVPTAPAFQPLGGKP